MDIKKNWLELLLVAAAAIGLVGWGLTQVLPVLAGHWLLVEVLASVALIGGSAPKWVPLGWKIYTTISDRMDIERTREQHYLMLSAVNAKIEQGFDTNYKNASHGFEIGVHNPYMKGQITKIQEVPNQQQIEAPRFPQPRDFAEILGSFMPNENSIFLLDTLNGPITVPMADVCHVALGGPTGGGKTNTTRLLIAQILACGGMVYMANPNFAPVKLNGQRLEDWRPIASRLQEPPAREIDEIKDLLGRFMTMFEKRRAQEQISPRRGKDVYLILGEWPAIVARWKEAPQILAMLLRESRQYGIHVISEFQDALISTIGGNSGVRENYRTAYYFGGDLNTAKVLLDLPKGEKIDDTGLGSMGAVYLRSKANAAAPGRVPMFSNRSLYALLGTPADPVGDDLVLSMDDLPDEFMPYRGSISGLPNFEKWVDASSNDEALSEISALPENAVDEPGEKLHENADGLPELGTDDYVLSDLQVQLFTAYYLDCGNISESLARIKNEKGQGLGRRYFKHASWIVKQNNLRSN